MERRYLDVQEIEVKVTETDERTIAGYAAVFNQRSRDLGGFHEIIKPGAFIDVINSDVDIKCLLNHDPNKLLARTKNGGLILTEDETGLRFEAKLNGTTVARDVAQMVERGDIDQCSFAFVVADKGDKFTEEKDGMYLREIYKIAALRDVSPVVYPAYEDTTVSMRTREILDSHLKTLQEQGKEVEYKRAQERRRRELELLKSLTGGTKKC